MPGNDPPLDGNARSIGGEGSEIQCFPTIEARQQLGIEVMLDVRFDEFHQLSELIDGRAVDEGPRIPDSQDGARRRLEFEEGEGFLGSLVARQTLTAKQAGDLIPTQGGSLSHRDPANSFLEHNVTIVFLEGAKDPKNDGGKQAEGGDGIQEYPVAGQRLGIGRNGLKCDLHEGHYANAREDTDQEAGNGGMLFVFGLDRPQVIRCGTLWILNGHWRRHRGLQLGIVPHTLH